MGLIAALPLLQQLQLDPAVVVTRCIANSGGIVPYPSPAPKPTPIPRNTLLDGEVQGMTT